MPSARPTHRRRALRLVLLLAGTVPAWASERSELLTARGELALHRGALVQALTEAEAAVAADPTDPGAQMLLGRIRLARGEHPAAAAAFETALALDPQLEAARRALALTRAVPAAGGSATSRGTGEIDRLAAVRTDTASRRWGLTFTTGVQYDSNVVLTPTGQLQQHRHDDAAYFIGLGGHYDLVDRPTMLLRLEYDFYQTLHPRIDEFDFRAHQVKATGSYALTPAVWVGVQGGYDHYTLGRHSYLSMPSVMPFLSIVEGTWGLTQLTYRHGDTTYLSEPFHEGRDGPLETAGVSQSLFFAGDRYATAGYQFLTEDPRRRAGSDWQAQSHELFLGGGTPLWHGVFVDALYLFRYDDYTRPNAAVAFRKTRQDDGHFFYVGLSRPIMEHVSVALTYYGTINVSNVAAYDFRRSVVAALLQVTY